MSRCILVLGMHRSGTSLVTEILSHLGAWLGTPEQLIGASEFNARGHFEFEAAVDFNNALLLAAGGTWDDPPSAEALAKVAGGTPPLAELATKELWALKDPRLCLTLPTWWPHLQQYDLRIVHVMRDCHAVAKSLVQRHDAQDIPNTRNPRGALTIEAAIELWTVYNRRAAESLSALQLAPIPVAYDSLVERPVEEVARIAELLGLDTGLDEAIACVRPDLRHDSRPPQQV